MTQLREHQEGDEARQIHWKQSARQDRLIVMDRQTQGRSPVYVVVDTRAEDPFDEETRERFEQLVSEAATTIVRRLERSQPVGLVLGPRIFPPERSGLRASVLLRPLATVQLKTMTESGPAVPPSWHGVAS